MDIQGDEIKAENSKLRDHLVDMFDGDSLSKGIEQSEFDEKYSAGFEIYTSQAIGAFIKDSSKEDSSEEVVKSITDELSTLTKVLVKGESGLEEFYVKRSAAIETEEKESEEEVEEEE